LRRQSRRKQQRHRENEEADGDLTALEITSAEKHDLLAQPVNSIFPEGEKGVSLQLKSLVEGAQAVGMICIVATDCGFEVRVE